MCCCSYATIVVMLLHVVVVVWLSHQLCEAPPVVGPSQPCGGPLWQGPTGAGVPSGPLHPT